MNRRNFIRAASGLVFVPAMAGAGIIGMSGSKLRGAGGGEPFTPLVDVNFDGLANGARIDSDGTPGKRFTSYGTYANGYGSRAVTNNQQAGKTSCAELSIRADTDGISPPDGIFGGSLGPAVFPATYFGETVWIAALIKFPVGFSFATDTGALKFFRLSQYAAGSETADGNRFDVLIKNSGGAGVGFSAVAEFAHRDSTVTNKNCDRRLSASGAYQQMCLAVKAGDAANSMFRIWVDGQLSFERTEGRYNKWFEGGSWQTQDLVAAGQTPVPTMKFTDGKIGGMLLFTYWNGHANGAFYPTQNQACNVQRVVFHKDESTLTGIDEFGNKFINMDDIA